MTLRTAEQYKEGLRDNRKVYILGEQVTDVTRDPYIKVGVETAACEFLMSHDPEYKNIAVMKDPETGEEVSSYFTVPDYPEFAAERYELIKASCYYSGFVLPFVKDVGADIINALTVVAALSGEKKYAERINEYRWYCARNDLAMAGVVTDVKGDRSKSPHKQKVSDYYLKVVDETEAEIVVSGAKAHITAAPYVDEFLVIPSRNMSEKDADYAVAFAIPASSPGITQICRPSFPYENKYDFPTPQPKRGHVESLVIFDKVRVPKSRVFMLREWEFAQNLAYTFAFFHRFTAVSYKIPVLEFMTGLGILVAEANGIHKASHVREQIINMIRYTETTKALAKAALHEPENILGSGYYIPNRLITNMAKLHFASNFHEYIRDIQDIAGGLLVTQPTYQDWENSTLRPYLERYLGGANGYNAAERLKLFSYLHHIGASDFAGWHEVCTLHAEGSLASQKMMLLIEAPIDFYKKKAKEIVGINV